MERTIPISQEELEACRRLVAYLEEDEAKHFEESGKPQDHIYQAVLKVKEAIAPKTERKMYAWTAHGETTLLFFAVNEDEAVELVLTQRQKDAKEAGLDDSRETAQGWFEQEDTLVEIDGWLPD